MGGDAFPREIDKRLTVLYVIACTLGLLIDVWNWRLIRSVSRQRESSQQRSLNASVLDQDHYSDKYNEEMEFPRTELSSFFVARHVRGPAYQVGQPESNRFGI